jgi:hypothetical protein
MKLVIDRTKWLRGTDSCLRDGDGKMCCLGFFGLACGIAPDALLDNANPQDIDDGAAKLWPEWLAYYSEEVGRWVDRMPAGTLVDINDGRGVDDAWREAAIAETFAQHAVEVEFVG